jgi:replicative superfamily II helicase
LLAATALFMALRDHNQAFLQRARETAINVHDGLLLSFLDAVDSWHVAAGRARPLEVLQAVDSTYEDPEMVSYIERRSVSVLFPAQITAIRSGATLDEDCVVSLPTSSGKTFIAELRVAASLKRHPGSHAIYVAPYRMLARQVESSFRRGLSPLGRTVTDLGSGYDPSAILHEQLDELPDVVICTPERLDALMRAAATETTAGDQAAELLSTCSVLVFDELQLVGRAGRGPRFELILARLRARYPQLQILGLCAASQGADELSEWLTGTDAIAGAKRPTGTLEILWQTDGTLQQRVLPRPTRVAELPRAKAVDDAANLILRLNSRYRPVLAVETTRPQAEGLARRLIEMSPASATEWRDSLTGENAASLNNAIEEVKALLGEEHPLAQYMNGGVAFHHAGVPTHALQQVERLAKDGLLRVVCATTTVAEGADLPFRVVVIPHLNFPGASRRLERDLYLNIIGRAGRANVSAEGIVFLLDSDAQTLRNVVRASLWSNTTADRIRGRLADVSLPVTSIETWNAYHDVQSQILGWLGDGKSYVEDQSRVLGEKTLTWHQGTAADRRSVSGLFSTALNDLEQNGYALAASPYRLTIRGERARMTGLAARSVLRLERAVEQRGDSLESYANQQELTPEMAQSIAQLLFEGLEVIEHGLWLRRNSSTDLSKVRAMLRLTAGDEEMHESPDYQVDVRLFSAWLMGASYTEIARLAPVYDRANALFGGTDEPKRTSDATEYIGKLTYPATWVWSGLRVLAGEVGDTLPSFMRQSIEFGVPTEGAAMLAARGAVTRPAAMHVTSVAGSDWDGIADWLRTATPDEVMALDMTALDLQRILALRERMSRESL